MIYLVAGHSNVNGKDNGAEGKGIVEGVEAVKVVQDLSQSLTKKGVPHFVDDYKRATPETVSLMKDLVKPNDLVIDIHFNSYNAMATGTEVLIRDKTDKLLEATAFGIVSVIAKTLSLNNRGVRTEADSARGKLGMLHIPCKAMIVEICFIDNVVDVATYKQNYKLLVEQITEYLKNIKN